MEAKQAVRELLEKLPDDCTIEDRVTTESVEILAFIHGARDFGRWRGGL